MAALALFAAGVALAASPAANAAFAKELRGYIKPAFAKQAPSLVLGKLTCVLPAKGTTVHCLAHFSDAAQKANVVYKISATLETSGDITWATTSHSCTSTTTGRKLEC